MVFPTVRARGRMFLFFLPERGIFIPINFPRTICRWLVAVWLHVLWKYFHTLRAKKNKKIETMNLYFFCRILKIGTSVKIKSQYVCFFFWNKIPWIFFFFFDFALHNNATRRIFISKVFVFWKIQIVKNIRARFILRIFWKVDRCNWDCFASKSK